MKVYDSLKELLEEKLKEIVKKGDINSTELENIYKAVDVIKDICEIEEKKEMESEYSMRSSRMRGGNYAVYGNYGYPEDYMSYRGGNSGGNSYYDGNSYRNSRNGGGYSRNGADHMIDQLADMMDIASSEQERRAIKECIEKLKD